MHSVGRQDIAILKEIKDLLRNICKQNTEALLELEELNTTMAVLTDLAQASVTDDDED